MAHVCEYEHAQNMTKCWYPGLKWNKAKRKTAFKHAARSVWNDVLNELNELNEQIQAVVKDREDSSHGHGHLPVRLFYFLDDVMLLS